MLKLRLGLDRRHFIRFERKSFYQAKMEEVTIRLFNGR